MEWPFVGRDVEIEEAIAWLGRADGNAIRVIGDPGIGKSRLATEIARRLSRDVEPLVLRGFESCALRPYHPFARVLGPDDRPASPRDAADRLKRWVAAAPIVVFDDIQWFDEDSAAAAATFLRDGWAPVVITSRAGTSLPAAFERLIDADYLLTTALSGLDRRSFGDAVDAALDGIMLEDSKDLLHHASAGNPLLARELLRTSRADGSLRSVGARWVLDTIPTTQDERVSDQIARHLAGLDPQMIAALETLAIAEPAPPDFAHVLLGDHYSNAVDAELIVDDNESVRFTHPLISASLRTTRSHLQRYAALRALVNTDSVSRYPDRLTVVEWRLELNDDVTLEELRRAASRAIRTNDHRGERFARAAIERGGGLGAELQLIAALRAVGSPERFSIIDESVIDEAEPGPERLGAILALSGQLAHHHGDLDAALALVDRGEELEPGPFNAAAFAAARAQYLSWFGRHFDALPHALEATESDINRFAQAGAYPNLVGSLLACGDPEAALRAAARSDTIANETFAFVGRTPSTLESNRVEALITLGRANAAFDHATATFERYRSSGFDHGHISALADAHANVGNVETAIDLYEDFIELLEERAVRGTGGYHAQLARLQCIAGRSELAERQLAASLEAEDGSDTVLQFRARLHLAALRDTLSDASIVEEGTEWCRREQRITHEVNLHVDLARLGVATQLNVDRMRQIAQQLDYEWIAVQAEAVRALALDEPDALLVSAERFAQAGFNGYAADLFAAAARSVARGRRPAFVADARRRRDEHLAGAPGWTVLGDPVNERTPGGLSPRERAVAVRAAAGMSTRMIAEELEVSPRTVANLVQRCYDKLGVNTREALAEMTAT